MIPVPWDGGLVAGEVEELMRANRFGEAFWFRDEEWSGGRQ